MTYTTNINLPMPAPTDFYDVEEFHNAAMRLIDAAEHNLHMQISSLSNFHIVGVVPTYADLPNPYDGVAGDMYLVQADETQGGKAMVYEYISGAWTLLGQFGMDMSKIPTVTVIPATTGTAAYTATSTIDAYKSGAVYIVTFSATNTGGVSLNINGLGAKPVTADNSSALKPGELLAGAAHLLVDNGAAFVLLSQRAILSAAQLNTPLTGYAAGGNAALAASDTLLSALGKLQGQVSARAPLASPAFSGNPTAPTPVSGDNDTSLATTAFVVNALMSALTSYATTAFVTQAKNDAIFQAAEAVGIDWLGYGDIDELNVGSVRINVSGLTASDGLVIIIPAGLSYYEEVGADTTIANICPYVTVGNGYFFASLTDGDEGSSAMVCHWVAFNMRH